MKIRKAVIPIAGKGTRFLPATKQISKEIIPILNTPMIQYVVDEVVRSGIEQIIFVTSYGKEEVENYFDRNIELETFLSEKKKTAELDMVKSIGTMIDIVTVRQKEQLGLGHAILSAKDVVGDEMFAVLLGDDLIRGEPAATKQLIETSIQFNNASIIGVMEVDKQETHKYGIVDGKRVDDKNTKMNTMIEKPSPESAPSNLATPGRYILSPSIFKLLETIPRGAGGEYQLTDAINLLCQSEDVYAHQFVGRRYDTGSLTGYLEATIDFALEDDQLKDFAKELIVKKAQELRG